MPKLTIHCEVETPDGEHAPVIEAIQLFERMPKERREMAVQGALEVGLTLPPHMGALIALGACIAYGKNTITSRPN